LNVTCDVVLDLIPLVKDNAASEDSKALILEHISTCEDCRREFESYSLPVPDKLDDKKIIASIKKSLFFIGLAILLVGSITGVAVSNSMGMFYNFVIMPFIGALSYAVLKRKWYFAPAGVLILTYLWLFISGIIKDGFSTEALSYPLFLSIIYTFLVLLGVLIYKLLNFAFRKGE
jgi:hypothetical protein